MYKKIKLINVLFIIILIILIICIINDYKYINEKNIRVNTYINDSIRYSDVYSYLKIDKINLKEIVYKIDSKKNNLNYGLLLFNEDPIVILGHSGHSVKALFNDLDKLSIGDKVKFNNNYYYVDQIYIKEKTNKLIYDGDLILVTCLKNSNNKQLVIKCKKNV